MGEQIRVGCLTDGSVVINRLVVHIGFTFLPPNKNSSGNHAGAAIFSYSLDSRAEPQSRRAAEVLKKKGKPDLEYLGEESVSAPSRLCARIYLRVRIR